jgi:hypothetical protein
LLINYFQISGYQPIFVLTKVDRMPDEVLIGHNENVHDSGVVDSTIQTFCNLSNIPRASVLPVINYQGPYDKPDYVVELLVLSIITFPFFYIYFLIL